MPGSLFSQVQSSSLERLTLAPTSDAALRYSLSHCPGVRILSIVPTSMSALAPPASAVTASTASEVRRASKSRSANIFARVQVWVA